MTKALDEGSFAIISAGVIPQLEKSGLAPDALKARYAGLKSALESHK